MVKGRDRGVVLQACRARKTGSGSCASIYRGGRTHRGRHQRNCLRQARREQAVLRPGGAGGAYPRPEALKAQESHARIRVDERHDRGRPQGLPQPRPRLRRGRALAGLAQRPGELVSAADTRAEEIIFAELQGAARLRIPDGRARRGHGCRHHPSLDVDPLDGTTNFLHGIPIFCISIALERDGELVAG